MSTISIKEIQRDLHAFLRRIEAGEALIVVRDEQPVAEVRPVAQTNTEQRPFGLSAGKFRVPVDFDQSLPDEVLREFEGR